MEEKEYNDVYVIPVNYTDSGKILGGMFEKRNAVEALILLFCIGYPELAYIPLQGKSKIILMTVTLIPVVAFSLMGINGDSLFQFVSHIFEFLIKKRRIMMKRIKKGEPENET